MNLTKPTHLKIILRKKGGKKFRIGNVGITVTKAHPPTTAPPSEIVGRGKKEKGMKLASSLAIQNAGMSYADTLKTTTKKEKGADKIPEFETPMLNQMERKLQILPNEWYQETYFQGDEYAALYAFYQPTQGPFIIVPSQTNMEIFPEFTLTGKFKFMSTVLIFCNCP
jgi:calpain